MGLINNKISIRVQCNKCTNIFKKTTLITNSYTVEFVNGKRWFKNLGCPKCYIKKKSNKIKELLGDKIIPNYYKDKLCLNCSGLLELSRYKICIKCKPDLCEDHFEYTSHDSA